MDFNLKTMLAFKILSPKMLNISSDFLMPISVSAARSLYIKHVKTGICELCPKNNNRTCLWVLCGSSLYKLNQAFPWGHSMKSLCMDALWTTALPRVKSTRSSFFALIPSSLGSTKSPKTASSSPFHNHQIPYLMPDIANATFPILTYFIKDWTKWVNSFNVNQTKKQNNSW